MSIPFSTSFLSSLPFVEKGLLSMEDHVCSIQLGKRADLLLIDLHHPHLIPSMGFISSLVLYGFTSIVDTVIVDGKMVKETRKITTVDTDLCFSRAQRLCEELWSRFFAEHLELRRYVDGSKPL